MRHLLIIAAIAGTVALSGCSESDGEDDPFFIIPPALTSFVVQQCNNTPENANAVRINGASFGSDAQPETQDPAGSIFTRNCIPSDS